VKIAENISLKPYNTFGVESTAKYFSTVETTEELRSLLSGEKFNELPKLILGGGSNILLSRDFRGLVIKNSIKGITPSSQDQEHVYLKAGSGEIWHDLVLYCISNDFAGIENLSLIPGTVGAAPLQNIGAYGVELKDVFFELEALSTEDFTLKTFSAAECGFGYRNSVFKQELKGKYIIVSVTLRLNKKAVLNTSYGAIEKELERMGVREPTIQTISKAVISIRNSKLPDPAKIGNAGSFFKNPELLPEEYARLKNQYEGLVAYPAENGRYKLAAGWLIEQCGWKGKRIADAGVHVNQALVLVNYGKATGKDILDLSEQIIVSVNRQFGITLEREVNLV
jgi:UDP-N-acetylmuramate dehydrogenase